MHGVRKISPISILRGVHKIIPIYMCVGVHKISPIYIGELVCIEVRYFTVPFLYI